MQPSNPVRSFVAVTLDTNYAPPRRGIYVGTSGDVSITMADGSGGTLPNLAAGVWHPIMGILRVNTSGTDAADIFVGN